jgi:hypothetical protein
MVDNLWDEEMKELYKDILKEYIEEGYDRQEAKHMAKAEVQEIYGEEADFAFSTAEKMYD